MTRPNPKRQLIYSAVWVFSSAIFLDAAYSRVQALRAEHVSVNPWRYGQVAFWIGMLIVFIYQTWFSFNRYRMDKKVV